MPALRNTKKLAAVNRDSNEEHLRNNFLRDTIVPRVNEDYFTQVSEEIKGRVTEKLSRKFSRTESRILGALSKQDNFRLNSQVWMKSGTIPETFRIYDR